MNCHKCREEISEDKGYTKFIGKSGELYFHEHTYNGKGCFRMWVLENTSEYIRECQNGD